MYLAEPIQLPLFKGMRPIVVTRNHLIVIGCAAITCIALMSMVSGRSEALVKSMSFDATARSEYARMDSDHNGLLTETEHNFAGRLEGDFLVADKNKNNSLSIEEYIAWEARKNGVTDTAYAGYRH